MIGLAPCHIILHLDRDLEKYFRFARMESVSIYWVHLNVFVMMGFLSKITLMTAAVMMMSVLWTCITVIHLPSVRTPMVPMTVSAERGSQVTGSTVRISMSVSVTMAAVIRMLSVSTLTGASDVFVMLASLEMDTLVR